MSVTRDRKADPTRPFRIGTPSVELPMWAILDDEKKVTIALTWSEAQAQLIVDALNVPSLPPPRPR